MAIQELKQDLPHTKNPDMIAFTLGRVTLRLMQTGKTVCIEEIQRMLVDVAKNGPQGGVTPEMARGALLALCDLRIVAA